MAKRERRRVRSSIDQLPAETRRRLEEMLADPNNGLTYRDMAEEVETQCGIRLSTSAIQRYAARYNRDAKQLKMMSERMLFTKAMASPIFFTLNVGRVW